MAALHLPDFTTLTFDCYGTLIDWERGLLAQLGPWRDRHRLRAGDGELLHAFGEAEGHCQREHPEAPYPEILRRVQGRLAKRFGVAASAADGDALARSVGDWPAFDDSRDALRALAERYRLIVLSNVDRASFRASSRRLGDPFFAVVTAQDVGCYKPDPRFFDRAFEQLAPRGVLPEHTVHVAQSLFHDHVPARRLGLPTVWVDRRAGRDGWGATPPPPEDVSPDLTVRTMAELADLDRAERAG